MGLDPISWAMIGSAVLGAGTSMDAQRKARNQAEEAATQAKQQADEAAKQQQAQAEQQQAQAEQQLNRQEQQFNRQNPRQASASMLNAGSRGGASSTMLTGPQGVDPGALTLGKSSLLGQ